MTCGTCDDSGSILFHRRTCAIRDGDGCDCFSNVDVSCPECAGGDAAEVARVNES